MSSPAAASPPVTSDHGSDGTARSNYTLMYIIIAVLVGVVLYVVIRYGRSVMAEYRQLQAGHGAARRVRVGLTTEEIAAFTYRVRAASASPLGRRSGGKGTAAECVVCLQDLEDGDVVRVLPSCRHFFHGGCIDVWLRAHSSCPVCRADLDPECERLREEVAVSRRVAGAALLRVEDPGGHPGTVAVEVSDSEGVRQGGRPVDEAAIAGVIRDYDCKVQDAVAHDEVQQAALVSFSEEHWSAGKCGSDYLGVVGASGAGDRDCQVHDAVAGKVKQSAVSEEHRSGGKYGSITLASPSPTATGEGGSGSLSKSSSPVHIQ